MIIPLTSESLQIHKYLFHLDYGHYYSNHYYQHTSYNIKVTYQCIHGCRQMYNFMIDQVKNVLAEFFVVVKCGVRNLKPDIRCAMSLSFK